MTPEEKMQLQEAPASASFKVMVNVEGTEPYEVLFTMRDLEAARLFAKVRAMIGYCADMGYKPPAPPQRGYPARKGPAPMPAPVDDNAPICPDHKKPMRKGPYNWYCSTKDAAGDWCQRKARLTA